MKVLIGWDTQNITPDQPVELIGQYYQRTSRGVRDPLAVTALAIEQAAPGGNEQTVMVTLDLIYVSRDFVQEVREAIRGRLPDLDPSRIFLHATHIHSGPAWQVAFRWWKPAAGVMAPAAVRKFMLTRVVQAIENAWGGRAEGGVSSADAYAPTGFCRRALYRDGTAMMYGETNHTDFVGMESASDPTVRMLFTWDRSQQLTGVIVNVACPAQVMESDYVISADFFGELRQRIHTAHGACVHLLAQVSAAGCQSPRHLPGQAADETNYWKAAGAIAIAQRLERAVAEGWETARSRIAWEPVLRHAVTNLVLPVRRASTAEYESAQAEVGRLTRGFAGVDDASRQLFSEFVADTQAGEQRLRHGPYDNKELPFVRLENAQAVIRRFENQDRVATFTLELHAVRVGECAFVTNPFELFLDYGQMIQARSRARRTFVVQLACDAGRYLPTERAVAAGGYSALIINGTVGPEGGRMLVDASLRAIEQLWQEK